MSNEQTCQHNLHVLFIRDTHGNVDHDVFHEIYDNIFLAVKDTDEQYDLIYDGEAKDLIEWCHRHNIEYRAEIVDVKFTNPFYKPECAA